MHDAELRFVDWGPGYLDQGENAFFGVVQLRPGDDFANHYHEKHDESFLVINGEVEIWLNREELTVLQKNDFIRCPVGMEHYLRNVGTEVFTAFFVKAPGVDADKVEVPWKPIG